MWGRQAQAPLPQRSPQVLPVALVSGAEGGVCGGQAGPLEKLWGQLCWNPATRSLPQSTLQDLQAKYLYCKLRFSSCVDRWRLTDGSRRCGETECREMGKVEAGGQRPEVRRASLEAGNNCLSPQLDIQSLLGPGSRPTQSPPSERSGI